MPDSALGTHLGHHKWFLITNAWTIGPDSWKALASSADLDWLDF